MLTMVLERMSLMGLLTDGEQEKSSDIEGDRMRYKEKIVFLVYILDI